MKQQKRKRRFLFRLWIFGTFLYVSNLKLLPYKRQRNNGTHSHKMRDLKRRLLEERGGGCQCCGKELDTSTCEFHHIVPYSLNGWHSNENNLMLVCHECHRNLHLNPLLNARLIEKHVAEHPEMLDKGETLETLFQREVKLNKPRILDKEWKLGPIRLTWGE